MHEVFKGVVEASFEIDEYAPLTINIYGCTDRFLFSIMGLRLW